MKKYSQKNETPAYEFQKSEIDRNYFWLNKEEIKLPQMLFGEFIMEGKTILCLHKINEYAQSLHLQICMALTKELSVFLEEPITLSGNTLYIVARNSENLIQKKLDCLMMNPSLPNDSEHTLILYSHAWRPHLDIINIFTLIEKYRPVLVVLDYPDWSNGKNINQSLSEKIFMNRMIRLLQSSPSAILISKKLKGNTFNNKRKLLSAEVMGMNLEQPLDGYFIFYEGGEENSFFLTREYESDLFEMDFTKALQVDPKTNWFTVGENSFIPEEISSINDFNKNQFNSKRSQQYIAFTLREKGMTYDEIASNMQKPKSTI